MPERMVDELVRPLMDEAHKLREVVEADNEQRKRENRRLLAVGVALVLILGAQLALLVQSRTRSIEYGKILETTSEAQQRIADCTTAGGKCYQEGQQRTGQVMRDLAKFNAYAVECGRDLSRSDAQVEACTVAKIEAAAKAAQAKAHPTPTPAR